MPQDERNRFQIIRKDAKNCFVESLNDSFPIGKAHFGFATYDTNKPAGSRQTNSIHIYIAMSEILELCRKLSSGEMRYILQQKHSSNDPKPIQEWLGGTSAAKLRQMGKSRPDGKSLSRTCKLSVSNRGGFLLIADSGPGEQDAKGLIVPKFGNKTENHVVIPMTWESFAELMLMTQTHYMAWLSTWYAGVNLNQSGNLLGYSNHPGQTGTDANQGGFDPPQERYYGSDYSDHPMF